MKPTNRLSSYTMHRGYTATRPLRVVTQSPRKSKKGLLLIVAILLIGWGGMSLFGEDTTPSTHKTVAVHSIPAAEPVNNCATSTLDQKILIDISRRHLWACQGTEEVYDAPVITGREHIVENKTPRGNFQIYAKAINQYLTGTDSTGSWDVKVKYWMPFLDNQYGTYGFHDATWRPSSDFGTVSPTADNASHGCIQMPVKAIAWLYSWAAVGTTVTIQD